MSIYLAFFFIFINKYWWLWVLGFLGSMYAEVVVEEKRLDLLSLVAEWSTRLFCLFLVLSILGNVIVKVRSLG